MNEAECNHDTIGFQSGDYYIFCRSCPAQWVRKDPLSGTDQPSPANANKGVGCTLSGENRYTAFIGEIEDVKP